MPDRLQPARIDAIDDTHDCRAVNDEFIGDVDAWRTFDGERVRDDDFDHRALDGNNVDPRLESDADDHRPADNNNIHNDHDADGRTDHHTHYWPT